LQFPPSNAAEPETINADVVIVGSGCGGAVAAKTLAEAGLKVIVVDKGYYWSPLRLPMSELEGSAHLFDNGGMMLSEGATVTIAAGSTWGGGGPDNWSASLQTQGYVRHEWSQKFGLKYFTSAEFQRDLDAVCSRMGVGTSAIQHNKTNEILLEGARKLGWSAKTVPQNTGGEAHNCGYCTYGRLLPPSIIAFLANMVHQVVAVAARKDQQRLSCQTPRKPARNSSKASHAQRCSSKTFRPQANAQQSA
jgi:choline dehydrogenase-like flavoprotein